MKRWLAQKHVRYALIAIACPLLTIISVLIYQHIKYADDWRNLHENRDIDNGHIAAFMAISEFIEIFIATGIACVLGSVFALLSIKNQIKLVGVGLIALLIVGLPLISIFLFWLSLIARN